MAEGILYIVVDLHGTVDHALVTESSESVQICGMRDAEGELIYFESEGYHLSSWCDVYGLQFYKFEIEVDLDALMSKYTVVEVVELLPKRKKKEV